MMTEANTFDQRIFDPNFSLDGTHLVAASAGTGKTYNIQNIYARIIMEKGFQVSQIQVMTFTDAATKELKDRLHAVLKDLQQCFAGKSCEGKNEKDTKARNQRARALVSCIADRNIARQRVELALLEFDNAAITTIHGFCQRVLMRYAFETGINLAMSIENNKTKELEMLATDWWRTHPDAAKAGMELKKLNNFTKILGGKADYVIVNKDASKGDGLMLKVANEIVERYEADRPMREKQNFDDLLRALRDALEGENGEELARKLRQDFKAALIDEFQDTDPVQYFIFSRIFLEGRLPLFFVGDPKQAIYSFRSGDIYTYMKACSIPGLQKHDLKTNFRSTRRLIDAVNAIFKDEGENYTFSDKDISYDGSITVLEEPDIKGPALKQPFRIITIPAMKNTKGLSLPETRKLAMPVLVKQILEVLSEKDENGKAIFSPSDIAVLLNAHTEEMRLKKMLARKGIPSVIEKSGNVFASAAAHELRSMLYAVLHPSGAALRSGLLTVFGGMSPEEFGDLENAEKLAEKVASFRELGNVWQRRGFYALVSALEGRGYQTRIAAREDGERMLTDMEQLLELCFATVKKIGPSAEKLLEWLNERAKIAMSDKEESEEYKRELEKDGEAVKIMTIYVSKGLQFPVVFLLDCWGLANTSDPRNKIHLPYYHNDEKRLTFELGEKVKEKTRVEIRQEKMRMLYVAMTRAVQRTILITPESNEIGNEPLAKLLDKAVGVPSIQWQKHDEIQYHAPDKYNPAQEAEPLLKAANTPVKLDASPSKGSYSSLSPNAGETGNDEGRDNDSQDDAHYQGENNEETLPIFKIPGGARIGTCWHNILEKIPFDASENELQKISIDELSKSGFMNVDDNENPMLTATTGMLRKVLDYPLLSPTGEQFKLSLIPWEKRLSEQEYNFSSANSVETTAALQRIINDYWKNDESKADFLQAMENWDIKIPKGFMTGFIDLVFQQGDFFYVVDWKSNMLDRRKESFNVEEIRREMCRHGYFFQYLLYSAVLHKYLEETLGNAYSWQRNFGGVRYYFLRGVAAGGSAPVFEDRPSKELLDALCKALGMEQ